MTDAVATRNRFVWHDLMAVDPTGSQRFFKQLFGWNTTEQDAGEMGKYTMITVGETGIGGILPLGSDSGIPAHWMAYVMVDDVDAVVDKARELGGNVVVDPQGDPEVARYAVIADPSGAMVAPVKGSFDIPEEPDGTPIAGTFCWNELMTTDVEGSQKFYQGVFGWTTSGFPMGEMGTYHIFKSGDSDAGGMMTIPAAADYPPFWLSYVAVDDVDASAAKARKLGGSVLVEPTDIAGVGRFALGQDPSGAVFGMFKGSAG